MDATQLLQPALTADSAEGIIERIVAEAANKIFEAHGSQGGLHVSRAWLYQRPEQVQALGGSAPWYVGWIDPDKKRHGKSCGPGSDGKRNAHRLKRKIEAELITGTYGTRSNATWAEFRAEYEAKHAAGLAEKTRENIEDTFDHFERLVKPGKVSAIRTHVIDQFRALRRKDRGKQSGATVAASTVNKDLRILKAALRKARRWGYLQEVPDFDFEREVKRLAEHLPPDHFALLYRACTHAKRPVGQAYPPAEWWRGLLVTIYLTGWRIGAVLKLARADVDLAAGVAFVRGCDTKGKRDQRVPLHPVVADHLRRLPGFSAELFPWPHATCKTLRNELHRLCRLAGIPKYGFHSLKKAFCTLNASRLEPSMLQFLAQHASFETTRAYYINPQSQAQEAVGKLFVPDVLKQAQ